MKFCKIKGKKYKIKRYIKMECNKRELPLIDIPFMSDYKFQEKSLNDRLQHPEKYRERENVPEVIEKLKKWLKEHSAEALT